MSEMGYGTAYNVKRRIVRKRIKLEEHKLKFMTTQSMLAFLTEILKNCTNLHLQFNN